MTAQGSPIRHPVRLCAVVVTFNRFAMVQKTVARLLAEPVDRLVLIDNGSTDGTREWLATQTDPRLDLILSTANTGGAGGFETGLRHAVAEYDPDWVVVMDDDARPEPSALQDFLAAADAGGTDGADAVAAAVFYPDGQICGMNRPVLNPFWHPQIFLRTFAGGGRAAFHLGDTDFARETPMAVDGTSFVGLFISRKGLQIAGYPDGGLFVYAEDGIYTLGLTRAGGKIVFFPKIRFEHECSTFAVAGQFSPVWKVYFYHRNLLFLYRRAAGLWFWPALLIVLPKWLLRGLSQEKQNRRDYYRLLGWAVRDGLTGRRGWRLDDLLARMRQA